MCRQTQKGLPLIETTLILSTGMYHSVHDLADGQLPPPIQNRCPRKPAIIPLLSMKEPPHPGACGAVQRQSQA